MNKRGEEEELLLNETINIIVAILCIVALIALVVVIYLATTANQNSRYAAASINLIANETSAINSGKFDSHDFLVPNPVGWFIFSFIGESKPNKCAGANCICICEDVTYILDWQKRLNQKCDDKGSCLVVQNLGPFDKIKIEKGGVFVLMNKVNGFIEITKK